MGAEIAERTYPVGLKKGVLYLWVKNSVWLQELIFLASPIRDKVNAFVGREFAREVRFTLDRKAVPRPEETEGDLREFLAAKLPSGDEEPPHDR